MATEQKYNAQLVAHLTKRTAEHGPDSIWAKMLAKAQAHQEGRNLINEALATPEENALQSIIEWTDADNLPAGATARCEHYARLLLLIRNAARSGLQGTCR